MFYGVTLKTFYISDTHFGHFNIIKHCNRPFSTAEEMDKVMIGNWNSIVARNDTVFILGDFVFSKIPPAEYFNKLNGRKIMIIGNHDHDISKRRDSYVKSKILEGVYNYLETKDVLDGNPVKIVMCHYPMVEWNGFYRDALHLYGHIHNSVDSASFQIMSKIDHAYNVGADILDFTPRTLAEVVEYNKKYR